MQLPIRDGALLSSFKFEFLWCSNGAPSLLVTIDRSIDKSASQQYYKYRGRACGRRDRGEERKGNEMKVWPVVRCGAGAGAWPWRCVYLLSAYDYRIHIMID